LHFGTPADLPSLVDCATTIDRNLPTLCVPIHAYGLWEGAFGFEFGLRTPTAPVGFDHGADISVLQMKVELDSEGAITSLRLGTNGRVCGPALLGCLQLATADLPESFRVTVAGHQETGRCAAGTADGTWRKLAVDHGGARLGPGLLCPPDPCAVHHPVRDLRAQHGAHFDFVDIEWTNGSGNYTMLRARTDGRFPADPWDGELLAFLPAGQTRYTHVASSPVELHIAAWSVSQGPQGNLFAASSIECGALASFQVQLPVATRPGSWTTVKTLFR
jgi:hypothetical protein